MFEKGGTPVSGTALGGGLIRVRRPPRARAGPELGYLSRSSAGIRSLFALSLALAVSFSSVIVFDLSSVFSVFFSTIKRRVCSKVSHTRTHLRWSVQLLAHRRLARSRTDPEPTEDGIRDRIRCIGILSSSIGH